MITNLNYKIHIFGETYVQHNYNSEYGFVYLEAVWQ